MVTSNQKIPKGNEDEAALMIDIYFSSSRETLTCIYKIREVRIVESSTFGFLVEDLKQ